MWVPRCRSSEEVPYYHTLQLMEYIIYDHILIIVSESDINSEKSLLFVTTPTPKNIFSRFQFQLRLRNFQIFDSDSDSDRLGVGVGIGFRRAVQFSNTQPLTHPPTPTPITSPLALVTQQTSDSNSPHRITSGNVFSSKSVFDVFLTLRTDKQTNNLCLLDSSLREREQHRDEMRRSYAANQHVVNNRVSNKNVRIVERHVKSDVMGSPNFVFQ